MSFPTTRFDPGKRGDRTDFQLTVGDTINLRLPNAQTHNSPPCVPLCRSRQRVSDRTRRTVSSSRTRAMSRSRRLTTRSAHFCRHGRPDTTAVAERIRALVGPSAKVTDIADTARHRGSSLTAVNLAGLTRWSWASGCAWRPRPGHWCSRCAWRNVDAPSRSPMPLAPRGIRLRSFVLAEACVLAVCGLVGGRLWVRCCHRCW